MNIQSLNANALVGATVPRQQNAGTATVPPTAVQAPTQGANTGTRPSNEQVDSAVKAANEFMSTVNNSLQFSIDKDTGTSIVRVIDKNTQELIRQIPSEEMLNIAKALDTITGLLVRQKA